MAIELNHTIVYSHDSKESAEFWADILGLEVSPRFGRFVPVKVANGVTFDFADVSSDVAEIQRAHYAFLVSEQDFDSGFAKIKKKNLSYWADPRQQYPGEINHNDGGRGVYFLDPSGHALEMLTVPYGGWPE